MLAKDKIRKTLDTLPAENLLIEETVERLILLDKVEQGLQDVQDGKSPRSMMPQSVNSLSVAIV